MARRGGGFAAGMAHNYNLDAAKYVAQQQAERAKETRESQNDRLREAHENMRDSLAQQGERLKAALAVDNYTKEMGKMKDAEQTALDTAKFRSVYRLLKEDSPNRNAQISQLFNDFPMAARNSEVQKDISEDDKRIAAATKPELSPQDANFLKENGPSNPKAYAAWQKAAGDTGAANHAEAAITYGHVWDLMKKQQGIPTGTPQGIDVPGYVKGIESTFQKLPNGQPNPAYQPPEGPPPPSTPAPANAEAWSNAQLPENAQPPILSRQQAPAQSPATGAPAAPTSQNAREFLQNMGFKKTSDSGAAAAATNDRNELNDMMNQTPETQFAAPKQPTPPPTPTPAPNKDQYYTA